MKLHLITGSSGALILMALGLGLPGSADAERPSYRPPRDAELWRPWRRLAEEGVRTEGDRGVWFWSSSSSPYGSVNILGDRELENETIADFIAWDIGVVYGSYSDLPADEPRLVSIWNAKLHSARFESQLLLSDNDWILEDTRQDMLDQIDSRLLDFHATARGTERFDALHLDIEPHGLSEWSGASDSEKRDLLELYIETIEEARDYLDAAGESALPIEVDLPVWYDSSSSAGWADDADRDDWFDRLLTAAQSVSMMAYERDSCSSIESGVDWEVARYPGQVRVGLDIDVPGTWVDMDEMFVVAEDLEGIYGSGIDIHAWRDLKEALE